GAVREALAPPGAARLLGVFFLVTLSFAVLYGTFSLAAEQRYGCAEVGCADRQVAVFWVYMGAVGVEVEGGLGGRLVGRLPGRRGAHLRTPWRFRTVRHGRHQRSGRSRVAARPDPSRTGRR